MLGILVGVTVFLTLTVSAAYVAPNAALAVCGEPPLISFPACLHLLSLCAQIPYVCIDRQIQTSHVWSDIGSVPYLYTWGCQPALYLQ